MGLTTQHFILKIMNPIFISGVGLFHRFLILLRRNDQSLLAILHLIENTDNLLQTTDKQLHQNLIVLKLCSVVALLLSYPFQMYSVSKLILNSDHLLINIMIFGLNVYNNFTAFCCELQFCSIAWLVFTRFSLVHCKLRKIQNSVRNSSCSVVISNNRQSDVQFLSDLFVLKHCQHYLCDICEKLNLFFGPVFIVSVSSLFVNVLLNLYFAIFGGFEKLATNEVIAQPLSSVLNSVGWSLYYFVRFVLLCTAAQLVSEKVINVSYSTYKTVRKSSKMIH